MLSLPLPVKIFLCRQPIDMRRGFDGLAALVKEHLDTDPFSGHLFVFRNRRADRIKMLYWDSDGFALWMKRLEKGSFRFPSFLEGSQKQGAHGLSIRANDLTLLLDGVDPSSVKRQKRYQRPATSEATTV